MGERMVSIFVAITDDDWFSYFAAQPQLDEVNFWQPRGSAGFRATAGRERAVVARVGQLRQAERRAQL
jgi:hypothetical protein